MNWLTGGGGDGWDDDDDLEDLSDQSLDEQQQQQQQVYEHAHAHPPPQQGQQPQPENNPGSMAIGGGLFMGRLTRFIEAVTQPESDEDDDGEGWDDDDDLDELVDDEGQVEPETSTDNTGMSFQERPYEPDNETAPISDRLRPPATPGSAAAADLMESGWDDDLDISFDPQPPSTEQQDAPLLDQANMTTSFLQENDQSPVSMADNVSSGEVVTKDDNEDNGGVVLQNMPHPSRQISSLSNVARTEAAVAPSASSLGWDDEDGLDDLVDEELVVEESPPPTVADNTPPPTAPTVQLDTDAGTQQTQSVSFVGALAVEAPVSGISSDGWNDDEDINVDDSMFDDGTRKVIDHTPPPPPPVRIESDSQAVSVAGRSTAAVAPSAASGWDDDDDALLDDLEVEQGAPDEMIPPKDNVVDVTPPPPLPRDSRASGSTAAIAIAGENGWDDDDDDLDTLDREDKAFEQDDETLMVDHTPPPPPPPETNPRDTTTEAAVNEDDDISQDDTLSIANSRARYEEQQLLNQLPPGPPVVDQIPEALAKAVPLRRSETADAIRSGNSVASSLYEESRAFVGGEVSNEGDANQQPIVDHTPSAASSSRLDRNASTEESMVVLNGGNTGANSSVADSWDTLSDRVQEIRPRSRRMVDMTPLARFTRGSQADASLGVAGHISIGESLDSIDEEGEELDSPPSTPGNEFVVNVATRERSSFLFGSGISALTMGGGIPRTTEEHDEDESNDGRPLVDHTPLPLVKNQSTAVSVGALSMSSEEGDLGESIVGIDDVKDDLYGNVVDHTPATPNPSERRKLSTKLANSSAKQEDDTVAGVAENVDVERDIEADNDMDDESSRGTKTTLEEFDSRSLVSMVRLTIPEEKQLVDHVPEDRKVPRSADASTVVFADASVGSSRVGDDIVNDDDMAPTGFGPIVDHTPNVHFRSTRSVATSVATQQSALDAERKKDEEMDNSVVAGGTSTVDEEDEWDAEQNSLPPSVNEEKHLVDHVPKTSNRGVPIDGSMRVMIDNADDSTQIDTIAEDVITQFGPVVDHTPLNTRSSNASVSASVAAVAPKSGEDIDDSSILGGSLAINGMNEWENDLPDLEDISAGDAEDFKETKEPTVVDHVPIRRSFSRPTDASTGVVVDPGDETSAADEDSTINNTTTGRFGPVVDQTPTPPRSGAVRSIDSSLRVQGGAENTDNQIPEEDDLEDGGTWFGASTLGGTSTIGASGDASTGENSSAGGWNDDAAVLDDLASPVSTVPKSDGSHLVDHVPKIAQSHPTDASTAALVDRSVASSHEQEEREGNIDVGDFGDVVDHTPSVTRTSNVSVANSIATVATGIATDIRRDEEMDDVTWQEAESAKENGDGWGPDEPELEDIAEMEDTRTPPVVDHVPERPESRPTDASTFVAGEASEIFSQVDDLGQDETHFGPVVDQLPRASFNVPPSATGSTIANIASVAEDDLDVAVERAIDGEDPRSEAQQQTGWQETLPNPQTGNEEDTRNREQLVDYVPAEEETEVPDLVRDASSEMATVGEKSNILPADDPKEDEFGPVVDHLPIPEDSSISTPIASTPLNIDDRKPAAVSPAGQVIDSVAPNFSIASKTSKEDELEEDEFGPVVDHLPTTSSRASITPSRGGSTVDALATVSEVEDSYVAGDGWEDDVDLDLGVDRGSPTAMASRSPDDRNLSVKWIDGLHGKGSPKDKPKNGDSEFFDAETGDSTRQPLNETRYYDPELGDTNAWGSQQGDNSDGDETPPSTPRRHVNGNESACELDDVLGCRLCANAPTADCPCIKSLLAANKGEEGMVGTLRTPDGTALKVDFDKLLMTEMTKRRLVEKEFQALKATIESLKSSKDTLTLAGETQMDTLRNLRAANADLLANIATKESKSKDLESQNDNLEATNTSLEEKIDALEKEKEQLSRDILSLERETNDLKTRINDLANLSSTRENELESEISTWRVSNEELSHKLAQFETECENLRGKNTSLYEDLESYQHCIAKLEQEKATIISRESALQVEVQQLQGSADRAISSGALQKRVNDMQKEVTAQQRECAELKSQLASMQKKLMESEAEKFKQTKELARVAQDKKATILGYEQRLAEAKNDTSSLMNSKDKMIEELNGKVKVANDSLLKTQEECAALEQRIKVDTTNRRVADAERTRQINDLEATLQSAASKIESMEKDKERNLAEMKALQKRSAAAEAKASQLLSTSKERDETKASLEEALSTIVQLEAQITQHGQGEDYIVKELQNQIFLLQQEREQLSTDLLVASDKFDEASLNLMSVEAEKEQLEQKILQLQTSQQDKLRGTGLSLERLSSELAQASMEKERAAAEQKEAENKLHQIRNELERTLGELDRSIEGRSELETLLQQSEEHVEALAADLNEARSSLEELKSQTDAFHGHTVEAPVATLALDDLARECGSLRDELNDARQKTEEQSREMAMLRAELTNAEVLRSENVGLVSKVEELQSRLHLLDQGRGAIDHIASVESDAMDAIKSQLEFISEERNQLLEERNMLEAENEEMLVQFGLLKEDMDATDAYVEKLVAERSELDNTTETLRRKLEEAQQHIKEAASKFESEREATRLASEVEKLASNNEELSRRNQTLEEVLESLEADKAGLIFQIESLNRQASETNEGVQLEHSHLLKTIEDLRSRNKDLTDDASLQAKHISDLQTSLVEAGEVKNEVDKLQKKYSSLDQVHAEAKRMLQQKDSAIEDLRSQLDDQGKAPVESMELETLRRTVQEMEDSAERDRLNIQDLEQLTDETTRELKRAMNQLSASEKLVAELREELKSKQSKERETEELQERLIATERQLEQANQDTLAFRSESTDLRGRLAALSAQLDDQRRVSQQPAEEPSGQSSSELQLLRQQIEILKQQQLVSSSQTGAREENIEREVNLLQQQMRQKDGEIGKLESQLQSLDSALSNKDKELESKQEFVDRLSSELQNLRSKSATSRALDVNREQAENSETMRQQIVSLAKALEQSEGRRALVIERLEVERQANADSLKRLTESVKRFYSTLSMGDIS